MKTWLALLSTMVFGLWGVSALADGYESQSKLVSPKYRTYSSDSGSRAHHPGKSRVFSAGGGQVLTVPGHGSGIVVQPFIFVQPPVALPERGSLFSTGQIGNFSAVPLPTHQQTDHGRHRTKHGGSVSRSTHSTITHGRHVIRLEHNTRTVITFPKRSGR